MRGLHLPEAEALQTSRVNHGLVRLVHRAQLIFVYMVLILSYSQAMGDEDGFLHSMILILGESGTKQGGPPRLAGSTQHGATVR